MLIIEHTIILVFSISILIIAKINSRSITSLFNVENKKINSSLSILIPARNEENNIGKCLKSLIEDPNPDFEFLVLDDNSTDKTSQIVSKLSEIDPRIRLIKGKKLPNDWTGKNWACHQLSSQAQGKLILFIDADTWVSNQTINKAATYMEGTQCDLLTVIPKRNPNCLIEKIMFPFIDWVTTSFLPIKFAGSIKTPYISATFGQFMMFQKEKYFEAGGHSSLKGNVLDDIELGRSIKRKGLNWKLLDGKKSVETEMYQTNIEAIKGLSRSIFPTFEYRISTFLAAAIILFLVSLGPYISIYLWLSGYYQNEIIAMISLSTLFFILYSWIIICSYFNHNKITTIIYPFIISVIFIIAIHSFFSYIFGLSKWKDRSINKYKIKL
ncbi:MAG: glycosyltransferase family 2 protein [SAR202 cluster bacterium]|nr:glycosyltransferase family 2 protein [SAR202 cluster bacterium]|tara:strand:- start:18598 stop:19746 length:1149 start_codon:yes stop_codon:yes gene_type:complete